MGLMDLVKVGCLVWIGLDVCVSNWCLWCRW